MRLWPLAFAAALTTAFTAAPALAEDYSALRACVADIEATAENPVFHYCTAQLAESCGAAKTAAEAVACIDAQSMALDAHIKAGRAALLAAKPESAADAEWYLDETRANTDAQCASMAGGDAQAGVPTGQRAVNLAFCQLIAIGDVYAALRRLETAE